MSNSCSIETKPTSNDQTQSFEPGPGKHVLFFGDPMCSWCWGFTPELQKLSDMAEGGAEFHLIMGGLRPGTVEPWDEAMRSYIRHHWEDVAAKTGQHFNFSRFEDTDFVYDTEPSARALVSVRSLSPHKSLAMYKALQCAFYAQNKDITDTQVLTRLAVELGVDETTFVDLFTSDDARNRVGFDYARTQAFGVQGFPSVVCAEDGQYAFLAMGYRPIVAMKDDFQAWLDA
ncbi:MAG: DsbA family protein [Magnetovibrio sp.]|nr:DsbA family protein [Magnetovibrio sp.]